MDTLLSVLHVVGAVMVIGPMALLPLAALRAVRAGNGAAVGLAARATVAFSGASLVVAALGLGALESSASPGNTVTVLRYGYSTPEDMPPGLGTGWVLASIVLYLAAFALSTFVVVPALRRAGTQIANGSAEGISRQYGRIATAAAAVAALLLGVTVLMVGRPDAYGLFRGLHDLTAVVVVGPMVVLPFAALRALRVGNAPVAVRLARLSRGFSAGSLVVAALGFAILAAGGTGPATFGWATYSADPLPPRVFVPTLTSGWVLTSIGLYVLALALSLLVVVPALMRSGTALTEGRPEGVQGRYGRAAVGSVGVAVLVLTVVVLMVWRP